MAAVLTAYNAPYGIDETNTRMWLRGTVAFTGSYTTGGVVPSYSTIKDVSGQAVLLPTLNVSPDELIVYGNGSGFIYQRIESTGAIVVLESAAESVTAGPLVQIAAAAFPAGVTGDVVHFVATWVKQ